MNKIKTLKDLQDRGCEEDFVDCYTISTKSLRRETIKLIKNIRLAKSWRIHQLSGNSGSAMFRIKTKRPKEIMCDDEINYYLQFGGLADDIPCNILKIIYNLTEEDLK